MFGDALTISTGLGSLTEAGQISLAGADLLGVEGITLLAMRPDGYVGLRSDQDHLAALENYHTLLHAGALKNFPDGLRCLEG